MSIIKAFLVASVLGIFGIGAAIAQDANGQTDMGSAQQHNSSSSTTDTSGGK